MNPKIIMRILSNADTRTKLRLAKVVPKFGKADDVVKCMLCPNMCLHVCPVFDVESRLTVSPSVKARLAYFASEEIFEALFRCVPCDACKSVCPMDISVDEILVKFRGGITAEEVRKRFEKELEKIERDIDEREGSLLYFPGCKALSSDLFEKTVEVLEKLGVDFALRNDVLCCGMPYYEIGMYSKFKTKISMLKSVASEYDGVISNCPHCVYIMRTNGIKATHVLNVLRPAKIGGDFSYHDPCVLARRLNLVEEPRKLLREMDINIHEPLFSKQNTYCCGYGGIYRYVDEESAKKMAKIRKSHFNFEIVTACPYCREALDAKDIVELILEGL